MQEQTLQLEQQSKLKVSGGLVLPGWPWPRGEEMLGRGGELPQQDLCPGLSTPSAWGRGGRGRLSGVGARAASLRGGLGSGPQHCVSAGVRSRGGAAEERADPRAG